MASGSDKKNDENKGTAEPQCEYKVKDLWSTKEVHDMGYGTKTISDLPNEQLLKEVVLLVLTVNENEDNAVLCYLEPLTGHADIYEYMQRVNNGPQVQTAIYLIGKYGAFPTAVRRITAGNEIGGAITAPNLAFSCFKSLNAIIGVGVACGVEKCTNICDVLVADKVNNYDQARLQEGGPLNRGTAVRVSDSLVAIFRRNIKWPDDEIKERLDRCNVPMPKIKQGIILSGPFLIDNKKIKKELIQNFAAEAIGIEMEAAYLFKAAPNVPTHMTIVKSVCDFGDGNKTKDFQPTAALLAANCLKKYFDSQQVLKLLQKEPVPDVQPNPVDTMQNLTISSTSTQVSSERHSHRMQEHSKLPPKPTYIALIELLDGVVSWRKVATYLLSDDKGTKAEIIARDHHRIEDCRAEMIREYIRSGEVSWEKVLEALQKAGEGDIAGKIRPLL